MQVPSQVWKYREFELVRGLIISSVKEILCYQRDFFMAFKNPSSLLCVVCLKVTQILSNLS